MLYKKVTIKMYNEVMENPLRTWLCKNIYLVMSIISQNDLSEEFSEIQTPFGAKQRSKLNTESNELCLRN